MKWLIDPRTEVGSVSLTFLSVAFLLAVVANILLMTGKVQNMAEIMDLLYSLLALYFGRR